MALSSIIRHTTYILLSLLLLACSRPEKPQHDSSAPEGFVVDVLLPTTPNRCQGKTELCWIYAMQAAIETDRLAQGDSIVLSPVWVERKSLEEQALRSFLTGEEISLRGTLPEAMRLMETYGVTAETGVVGNDDNSQTPSSVLARKVQTLAQTMSSTRQGSQTLKDKLSDMLDDETAPVPRFVFMLGFEYTPRQFFESCCMPGEWKAYTSFTHHPFGEECDIEVADNRHHLKAMNIQIDSLLQMVHASLRNSHPVAWEGCMNPLTEKGGLSTQERRQQLFETRQTTDDHCMAIIGSGHDRSGKRYFIFKNSWAGDGRYYMTEEQFLLSTIIVMI